MGKRQFLSEEQSFIPAIQEVEGLCRRMLEQARGEAAAEVLAAQREAEEETARAREQLPLRMERLHQEELARLQASVPAPGREAEALARRAERNLERAAAAIAARVWKEGP
jgi:hypothetical protein